MAATDRESLPRTTGVAFTGLVLAVLAACTSDSSAPGAATPSKPASSAARPTPSRFASMADMDPCGIFTADEQQDLVVHPGPLSTPGENLESCSWLAQSGASLFDVSLWKRSAGFVTTALSQPDPLTGRIGLFGQIKQTSVNGRPAFQYRRQSQGMPPGACGVQLAIDDASSVGFEWHAGQPCEGDQTKAHWDRALAVIESKLPPAG
jgi:hypothetical protein